MQNRQVIAVSNKQLMVSIIKYKTKSSNQMSITRNIGTKYMNILAHILANDFNKNSERTYYS